MAADLHFLPVLAKACLFWSALAGLCLLMCVCCSVVAGLCLIVCLASVYAKFLFFSFLCVIYKQTGNIYFEVSVLRYSHVQVSLIIKCSEG